MNRQQRYGLRRTLKARLRRTADWLEANPTRWGQGAVCGRRTPLFSGLLLAAEYDPDSKPQVLAERNPDLCFCAYGAAAVANRAPRMGYTGFRHGLAAPTAEVEVEEILDAAFRRTGLSEHGQGLVGYNDQLNRSVQDVIHALRATADAL